MDQYHDLDSIIRMSGSELETLAIRYNIKIIKIDYKLPALTIDISFDNILNNYDITDEQHSDLYANLVINQIYCIKGLYNKGLIKLEGKYFKYLMDTNDNINFICGLCKLPQIDDFEDYEYDEGDCFFNIYMIYKDLISYEKYNIKFAHICIKLDINLDILNIINNPNVISISDIYTNEKYIEQHERLKFYLDHTDNNGIIYKINSIEDVLSFVYNLSNINGIKYKIDYISYFHDNYNILIFRYK